MSLLPPKLSRYTAVAALLARHRRAGVGAADGLDALAPDGAAAVGAAEQPDAAPDDLAADLERLGPTFVKLGQPLSTRTDLLAPPYLAALSRLQDDVEPIALADVQQVIEEELGVRLSKAFSEFDEVPLAAASLGQVHRAALRDGRLVAVKIQRPGIVDQVRADLEALEEVARFVDRHSDAGHRLNVVGIVDEFREALVAELDYRREAANLRLVGRHLLEFDICSSRSPSRGTPRRRC